MLEEEAGIWDSGIADARVGAQVIQERFIPKCCNFRVKVSFRIGDHPPRTESGEYTWYQSRQT